jgi:hypothetical protein
VRKRGPWWIWLALPAAGMLASCRPDTKVAAPEIRPVRTVTATNGEAAETVALTGHIQAEDEPAFASASAGDRKTGQCRRPRHQSRPWERPRDEEASFPYRRRSHPSGIIVRVWVGGDMILNYERVVAKPAGQPDAQVIRMTIRQVW